MAPGKMSSFLATPLFYVRISQKDALGFDPEKEKEQEMDQEIEMDENKWPRSQKSLLSLFKLVAVIYPTG